MSSTGMRSVMAMMRPIPESTCSMMASAAKGAGTKITPALAPVSSTASAADSKTGTASSNFCPPRPGWTAATMLVPYSRHRLAWKLPSRPRPCTSSRASGPTRTLMRVTLPGSTLVPRTRPKGRSPE